jgi:hypothetical protein
VPEIARTDAGGDHEVVVVETHLAAIRHRDPYLASLRIDAFDLRHRHGDVRLTPEDLADRSRDVTRSEPRGGHLVEQRLEEMVILAIHQRDTHRRAAQGRDGCEAAEAAAEHDDVRQRPGGP